MNYQAARSGESEKDFDSIKSALEYIDGSAVDSTRPWLRVKSGASVLGSFLVVSGRKMDQANHGIKTHGPILLSLGDQKLFDDWRYTPPAVKDLLKEIDLCNNGYARLDCLPKASRGAIVDALALGLVKVGAGPLGVDVVHRTELKMGVINVPKGDAASTLSDDCDWEDAILERQERESMRG
jgi:hypothetical protein